MAPFTQLIVWKTAMALAKEIYAITKMFPKEELYGLTSQLRRACTSILANLAEGCGRFTYADKAHKFVIARGECAEVEALLLFAIEIDLVKIDRCRNAFALIESTGRMLSGLINSSRSH
ncbi:four helix bundle protein [Candidatus Peregrinibacteria bacterium]|nr:four helix bundle protein [Candidatus Peregrinibacteria bacterium]MBI3816354.1 four helix bundle protein [Candidatus Peregrinibacteria bacterium]